MNEENAIVYPVYILSRVVHGIKEHCKKENPKEALGVLIGYKKQYKGKFFTKIIDWATGRVSSSSVFARFEYEGILDYRLFIKERYGENKGAPYIVGIYHSHPFGHTPNFSSTDFELFFTPIYASIGNVFILVDPIIDAFRVYTFIKNNENEITFQEVEWCEYEPYYNPEPSKLEHEKNETAREDEEDIQEAE